jgi:hypothetical protein
MDKLSSHATTIAADGDAMVVTYHRTQIVRFTEGAITLCMGGYDTVTTRRKMNQAAAQFRLPFSVYRDKGETFMRSTLTGETVPMDTTGRNILPRRTRATV